MTTRKAFDGKPYAGNPHVRFDEGEFASLATLRRRAMLYGRLGLFMAVSWGSLAVSAVEYTAAWSTGETPASLADGKVTLTYEGEGADARITAIAANPGYGNSVVISGDTMALAANPTITVEEGVIRFDNSLDGTGMLTCRSADGTDRVTWENSTNCLTPQWQLVFPDRYLDDYDIVAAQGKGVGYNPNQMTAYNVMRRTEGGVSYLDYQLQYGFDNSGLNAIKALWVTLKQTDDGIAAVITNTVLVTAKTADVTVLGKDINAMVTNTTEYTIKYYPVATTPDNVEKGYGMNRIILKRTGNLPQVRLEGLVTNSTDGTLMPVSVVAGASVWAGNGSVVGQLPSGSSVQNAGDFVFGNTWGPDDTYPMFEQHGALASSGTLRYVRDEGERECSEYYQEAYLSSGWKTVGFGVTLYDVTNFIGKINGGYIGSGGKNKTCSMYHYRISENGLVATGQVQAVAAGLRCIVMAFRQNGFTVQMSAVTCYCGDTAEGSTTLGYDFIAAAENGLVGHGIKSANFVTTEDGKGYAVHEFRVLYGLPTAYVARGYQSSSSLSIANGSTVEVAGTDKQRMMVEFSRANSLPQNGLLEVRNGGCAVLNPNTTAHPESNYFAKGSCLIRVHPGGMLCQRGKWAIGYSQKIELLGGTLWCGYVPSTGVFESNTYASQVEFRDGAVLKGLPAVRIGLATENGYWRVRGSSPSSCEVSIVAVSQKRNGLNVFTWDVDDVTGSAAVDFNLNGALSRFTGDNTHTNIEMRKVGEGTISLNAACPADAALVGKTIIEEGTWLLNTNGAMREESPIRLAGGTLAVAAGMSNALGALSITAEGGGISLGAGATLTFADSRAAAWEQNGKVEVTGFVEGAIRFGLSKNEVPRKSGFFTTGGGSVPLFVNTSGYLTAIPPGTVILFR